MMEDLKNVQINKALRDQLLAEINDAFKEAD